MSLFCGQIIIFLSYKHAIISPTLKILSFILQALLILPASSALLQFASNRKFTSIVCLSEIPCLSPTFSTQSSYNSTCGGLLGLTGLNLRLGFQALAHLASEPHLTALLTFSFWKHLFFPGWPLLQIRFYFSIPLLTPSHHPHIKVAHIATSAGNTLLSCWAHCFLISVVQNLAEMYFLMPCSAESW